MLKSEEVTEQGFVNFIDILGRFNPAIAQKGIAGFTRKAFTNAVAKERFESLIEHYFDDPQSPMRNDRVYSFFLAEMKKSPYFDEAENNKVKATTGQTVIAFITSIRLKEAQRIIRSNPNILISDVATQVGFNTPKYFSKCFKKEFGIFPKEYAEKLKKD